MTLLLIAGTVLGGLWILETVVCLITYRREIKSGRT